MTKYIELIDRYEIRQSDSDEYNPPSYIWRDNTGEIIRCKDCKYYSCGTIEGKHLCMSVKYRFTPTTEDEWCSRAERKEECVTDTI